MFQEERSHVMQQHLVTACGGLGTKEEPTSGQQNACRSRTARDKVSAEKVTGYGAHLTAAPSQDRDPQAHK